MRLFLLAFALLGAADGGRDGGDPDAGLPIPLPVQDGGQDAGAARDSGVERAWPTSKAADPRDWQQACGVKCYCADRVTPRVCFCSQPAPHDGTVYIFTPSIEIHLSDGGVLEAPL